MKKILFIILILLFILSGCNSTYLEEQADNFVYFALERIKNEYDDEFQIEIDNIKWIGVSYINDEDEEVNSIVYYVKYNLSNSKLDRYAFVEITESTKLPVEVTGFDYFTSIQKLDEHYEHLLKFAKEDAKEYYETVNFEEGIISNSVISKSLKTIK